MAGWLPHSGWRLSNEFTFEVIRSIPSSFDGPQLIEMWAPVKPL
jgi:hypothetical protein